MFDDRSSPLPHAQPPDTSSVGTAPLSAAIQRFHSCRWRRPPEEGSPLDYCTHRDVQPIAGTTGFDPEAWCPDCAFYKVRRIPRKRPVDEYQY